MAENTSKEPDKKEMLKLMVEIETIFGDAKENLPSSLFPKESVMEGSVSFRVQAGIGYYIIIYDDKTGSTVTIKTLEFLNEFLEHCSEEFKKRLLLAREKGFLPKIGDVFIDIKTFKVYNDLWEFYYKMNA